MKERMKSGLRDTKGEMICLGDTVRCTISLGVFGEFPATGKVEFNDGCFEIHYSSDDGLHSGREYLKYPVMNRACTITGREEPSGDGGREEPGVQLLDGFSVIDKTTGKYPDLAKIAAEEQWAKDAFLLWCDMDGFTVDECGELMLQDECGHCAYCPEGRFIVVPKKTAAKKPSADVWMKSNGCTGPVIRCPECGKPIGKGTLVCGCGQHIDWDGTAG